MKHVQPGGPGTWYREPEACVPGALRPRHPVTGEERQERMRAVVEETGPALRRYLLRLSHGRPDAAEDLYQEVLLRVWRKIDMLPDGSESRRRWLFTVARNLVIDDNRARACRPEEVFGEDISHLPSTADEVFEHLDDRQVARQLLDVLTPAQRAVLVWQHYYDASVAETAAHLGIPEGTVRSRTYYALRAARAVAATPAGLR
ncbi:sigma-70 family RNA polymerase sigma factor [Kineosporia sp. J2-2]|uniref:Sigma-70 family RNA polymerase sigma factor n=1 Tax=Kineosporia corallincola TaxID=2835133 RepID=A0ABS5TAQ9_9ACTN|nr:sigma-70 family RNA polymerase sigma factor [Kineosporia corallincola]MBT0768153.1 sigma-70 family RNA polymerase sigma factor [Kineosporia corallincola]